MPDTQGEEQLQRCLLQHSILSGIEAMDLHCQHHRSSDPNPDVGREALIVDRIVYEEAAWQGAEFPRLALVSGLVAVGGTHDAEGSRRPDQCQLLSDAALLLRVRHRLMVMLPPTLIWR